MEALVSTDGKLRLQNVANSIFVIPNEFETAASRRLMEPTVPVIGGDGVLFGLITKSFYGL